MEIRSCINAVPIFRDLIFGGANVADVVSGHSQSVLHGAAHHSGPSMGDNVGLAVTVSYQPGTKHGELIIFRLHVELHDQMSKTLPVYPLRWL